MNSAIAESSQPFVTLALSGGGSRAIAFHLGCLRALHDRGLLEKVKVVSTVSGGSVIGACFAYWGVEFAEFDRRIVRILRKGFNKSIARSVFFSQETPKIMATLLCTAVPTLVLGTVRNGLRLIRIITGLPTRKTENWMTFMSQSLPIWGSLTTAFENALQRNVFGNTMLPDVKRPGVEVVINACDLRTGTAFRFGSQASGGWRYGRITENNIPLAKAVAASAAFPLMLPPLVDEFRFERAGAIAVEKVVLTDGGVFDNLGVAVLEPGRDSGASINRFPTTHIISLNAGPGQVSGDTSPFWWLSRVRQSFETVHRKVQDSAYSRLHRYVKSGELKGFGMVYLGQIDGRLPYQPDNLVPREAVRDYPTNFASMAQNDLDKLALRGEQLTQIIVDRYLSHI
ncbi:patatin-like phospholipase family protein [Acidithiobacillus sp.]|uniref:patatin-like phospholipase family protein n=1 Tax=Acidithiobacillus sp. TaxID=1872118 RepID=UPI00232207B3|nr:patatin-like phospholipase family protein [Acidithiobacillus sp.]MDA8246098.1 patatin-like phospholipase family protein [Acidithiobacillus sp.]